MTKNIGNNDKLIRFIIAVGLFLWVYLDKSMGSNMQYVLLILAFIAALTSLLNFCLLYKILGIGFERGHELHELSF